LVAGLEVRPFADGDIDDAARLLAVRHRAQRLVEPGLAPAFEDVSATRPAIEALAATPGASGAVALRGGALVGYLIGTARDPMWGANAWVEGAGHAVVEPELVRDLYGLAAAGWVERGVTSHYAIVPATDPALVDAWFRLGFGQQHVHAIRDAAGPDEALRPPAGIVIRLAERGDIPILARLDIVLPEHHSRSPVFSARPPSTLEEATKSWEEDFADARFVNLVAEHDGVVVGCAIGGPIEVSSEHRGIVQPPGAGFLGFAAVLPEARGLGAGRALGEAVILWSRDAGHPTVVTDWRETNLLSSRTWPRLGFRPTFRRLYRAIA
jgi:GNAT superfamily N-acetyltransferase